MYLGKIEWLGIIEEIDLDLLSEAENYGTPLWQPPKRIVVS
jgi:hypothetical protein